MTPSEPERIDETGAVIGYIMFGVVFWAAIAVAIMA